MYVYVYVYNAVNTLNICTVYKKTDQAKHGNRSKIFYECYNGLLQLLALV